MKHSLRHFVFSFLCVLFFTVTLISQNASQAARNCPGVPGACGYPSQNQNHSPSVPNPAPQNGNGTLGVIFDMQKCGLNYAHASQRLGKRFSPAGINQPAPFVISGIPTCAVIEKAYLWAEGSGNGAAQTATIAGPLGTANYPMAIVGTGPDKCWGYGGTYTYRADVTASFGGNGTYNVSGILTNPPTSGNDMDGATLIVIWSQPNQPWAGRIVIADGAYVVNGGVANYNMPISPAVCGATSNASAFLGVGDIQFNPTSWTANGTAVPLSWNWWNFHQVATTVTTGATTSNFNVNTGGDCFNLCIAGLYFRTTTCMTCPATASLTVNTTMTPATCSNCNGTATVTSIVGGSAPYTYSWAPSGGTGATATGLCAGTYTVTVTANAGCLTQTQVVTVTSAGGALSVTGSQNNVTCFGLCNGSASTSASGGTAPYTYAWSPAVPNTTTSPNNSASNLCPGTYTITATDAAGCTGTRTITITQPTALATTGGQTNILCNGGTGSATVTPSGGTGPYTYAWAPSGGTGATATGLGAGTYTVTVTDANGCTTTRTYTITQPAALTSTGSQTNILCNAATTGAASVTPSGGTGPYTYAWAPSGGTGATATGLGIGTYTVTVTDANGCTTTRTYTITQPPAITITPTQTNILCNGNTTGAASGAVTGGNGPYTYAWSPSGGTGSTATGLGAGTYTLTVTDANGCTRTQTYTITQPTALSTTGTQTNVLCNGGSTGAASVTASGGTGPYTYSWAPAGGTGSSATGLASGTYTVTVTDANGCTITRTYNITQPTALTATTSFTQATCGSANGAASVAPTGGTGPYTYSWAPSGGTGATATGLVSAIYTVTVTDANGCTITRTVNVPNAGSPTATITATTNVTCFGGNNGSATVSASGGTTPYTYAWTPTGGTGSTGTAMIAGNYTATVTDANGCSTTATVVITQPPAITVTATSTAVLCFGGNTGSAAVTASGGTPGYTYSWAPSGGTSASASSLTAGTYTVTVTDANGCTATAITTVTQPTALTATATSSPVLCFGGNTGSAAVTASGGTSGYTYSWAPSGGTGSSATGLTAGGYTVTITDANGCTTTASTTVTQPTALATTTSFTQATCGNANGSASVTPSGGTGPYTYSWAPSGGTGATATGLVAAIYTVTVTDANGCTITATVNVPNAGSPTATITASTNVSCFGGNNGSATVSAAGGTGPYTYAWTPTGGTGTTGSPLTAGNYTVTVTDANGCSTTATVAITEPPALTATATASPVLCFGGNTGSAAVTATGGVGPYTYNWAPSGGTGSSATGLTAGGYTVTVTDANGCTTTASATVTQPTALTATATSSPVLCFGGNTGSASVTASGGVGPYTYSWAPSGGTGSSATSLTAGGYTVTITDANGCTTTASTTVTEPTALTATTSFTQATCGNANGSADVIASGGTSGYTYSWAPSGGTGSTATGLVAAVYTVTVTDANGCTVTATANVPNALSPTVTIIASDSVSCFGGNDGYAAASSSGGTTPYTYLWSNADADTLAGNLIAGSYTVTVTDANGCTSTATVSIGEPPVLTAAATSTDVLCFGGNTGTAAATYTGGTGTPSYSWAPSGGTGASASALTAGIYTVTITDINGCTATATTTVNEPPVLAATTTATDALCFGGNTGSATVTATGGFGNYAYSWAPSGGTGTTEGNLIAGTYTVTVTDDNGCTATATATVNEPTAVTAVTSFTLTTCNASNGSAAVVASGGTPGYTYLWSPSGGTGATETGLSAGLYSCVITDNNGCSITATVTVPNAAGPSAVIAPPTMVLCFGGNNGSATASANGGTAPYTYSWSNADNDSIAGSLIAGSYTVTVTDFYGCTSTASVVITEPSMLNVQANANPTVVCEGSPVQLSANAGGGVPAYTYSWQPIAASGATQTITPASSQVYTVTVTDANGCTTTATTSVTVNPMPTPVTAADITSGCAPLCLTFTDASSVTTGTITGWLWDFGDNTTSTQQNPVLHCYNTPGNYTVVLTVTTSAGCTQTVTMANYISVYAMPVAAFGAGPLPTTVLNPTITFTDSSQNASSWLWSFGDLNNSSSTDQNPSFTYPDADCYMVVLEVTSADGCQDTATMPVCIDPDVTIYVPNTFTPDGNGLNDEFIPVTIGIDPDQYELWIFDRWGNMIFYSDELNEGWDGRVQGHADICQQDTYVWKIKAKDILGNSHNLIGHVNLIK
ncbi:MAG: hypothetical protein RL007_558 [Bacteroidota bacterium]|jgi:gliding motility-associated-like protein